MSLSAVIGRPGAARGRSRARAAAIVAAASFSPAAVAGDSLVYVGPNNGAWDSSGSATPNWFNQTLGTTVNVPPQTSDVLVAVSGTSGVSGLTVRYNLVAPGSGYASLLVGSGNTVSQTATTSLLLVTGTQTIGGTAGGTLLLSGGTNHSAALTIGAQAASTGTVTLTGGRLLVDDAITVGDAGAGTLNYRGGVLQAGAINVGNTGGFGTFSVSNGASLSVGTQLIGNGGIGVYNQFAGATNVVSNLVLGNLASGSGVANVTGGTLTVSPGGAASIGAGGIGRFFHTGGIVTTPSLLVATANGTATASLGFYSMSNAAALVVNGDLVVGHTGFGVFNQSGGTTSVSGTFNVGASGSNNAFVTVTGGSLTAASTQNDGVIQVVAGNATLGTTTGATSGRLLIGAASGGTALTTVTSIAHSAVTINNTGTLRIAAGTARLSNSIGALTMGSGAATFDIGNHDVLITGSTSAINALVKQAAGPAAGGLNPWNGVGGITSALVKADAAAAHPGQLAIGVKNNADFVANGGKPVPAGRVLVSYAAYGDANLDNNVDIADLSIWNNNFGVGDHWGQGDFNYDGVIDIADLSIWNNGFGGSVSPSAPAGAAASNSSNTSQHGGKAIASAGAMAAAASLSGDAPAHANATPPAGTLELDIDPSTGRAYLNSGGVSLAAIQIDSSTKNMTPGTGAGNNWNSFRLTQGYSAKGWSFQKGGPTSGTVVESTTDATSASGFPINLPAGTVYDYGAIFPVGFGLNAGDLASIKFQYNYVDNPTAGTTVNTLGVVALTPEPGSITGLLALAGAGLMGRRRRRRQPISV